MFTRKAFNRKMTWLPIQIDHHEGSLETTSTTENGNVEKQNSSDRSVKYYISEKKNRYPFRHLKEITIIKMSTSSSSYSLSSNSASPVSSLAFVLSTADHDQDLNAQGQGIPDLMDSSSDISSIIETVESSNFIATHQSSSISNHSNSIANANPNPIQTSVVTPHAKVSEPVKLNQSELRRQIIAIQNDPLISSSDKARKVQSLMTSNWTARQKESERPLSAPNKLSNKESDFTTLQKTDSLPAWHNEDLEILGCKHYQRGAKLQGHCCGRWFPCRFCHDEVSDHNIVRNLTTTMMCMHCSHIQPAGRECINEKCKKIISKYYCQECKLWDDDGRKNIYHCHDCGICRIGKGLGQDYFHCKKCNVCMAISLQGKHKCIERNLESDCPICGEYMFTSTTTVIFMPCGHCIHYKCHQEYIQSSYQCPTCSKSLANMTDYFKRIDAMLEIHSMPPEYTNTHSNIYCNDCEKKSVAKYHFLYHKCEHCKGYNSKVLSTFEHEEHRLDVEMDEEEIEVQ